MTFLEYTLKVQSDGLYQLYFDTVWVVLAQEIQSHLYLNLPTDTETAQVWSFLKIRFYWYHTLFSLPI